MPQTRARFWVLLALIVLAGVACAAPPGGSEPAAPAPPAELPAPTDAPADAPPDASTDAPPPEATVAEEAGEAGVEPDPAPAEPEQAATRLPGRPDAPAGAEFRSDPSSVVAATGGPQLLEFFTYW